MQLFKKKKPSLRSILFVCTANITRSPTAEYLFREEANKSKEIWEVASAGANTMKGLSANPVISVIMFRRNKSIKNHRSQVVSKKLLLRYHWIIVMEDKHREALLKLDKSIANRIFLFRELTGNNQLESRDMPDPTGKDVDDYRQLFSIFEIEISLLFQIMKDKVNEAETENYGFYD
ncbi:MAG: hypothetical protein P9X24_16300 [Candidatus Hatepunaea meridiana]|nr:hypothetical protein [Candidatus Hatepunaea meridiana]